MRKFLLVLLSILAIAFIAIQFYQPAKNTSEGSGNDILALQQVPDDIAGILKNSCFDCHSNNTRYHWYNRVAPASWMVNKHIVNGKNELNFSNWGEMDVYKKITTLEEICRETEHRHMPLKSYLLMHPGAKLSDEQISVLCKWSNDLGEELLVRAAEK